MPKTAPKKNEEIKSPIASSKREKQFEIVQLWRKRDFPYADPNDATEDEIATARYRPNATFILLKIPKGFNMDGTPRNKVFQLNLPDAAHPKMLTRRSGTEIVESKFGIALSTFRIAAKTPEVVKSLLEHAMCWQPESSDPWKADKNGKAFYIRELREDAKAAFEKAVVSTDKAPTIEDNRISDYDDGMEVEFADEEVEELVA